MSKLRQLPHEGGQTMAEYGVVLSFMVIMALAALMLLSGNIVTALHHVSGFINP